MIPAGRSKDSNGQGPALGLLRAGVAEILGEAAQRFLSAALRRATRGADLSAEVLR